MKKLTYLIIVAILTALLAIPASAAVAQNAGTQVWTSAIEYMNPGTSDGSLTVSFYNGATAYSSSAMDVADKASGTLLVGGVSGLPASFNGSAVFSSNVPIIATYREFVSGDAFNYAQQLYNAFNSSQAGNTIYLAAAMKRAFSAQQTSVIGIQNVGASSVEATLDFFAVGSTTPQHTIVTDIDPQASYVFNMDDISDSDIPDNFNGALRVTADGPVVGALTELYYNGRRAYAFESVSGGSNIVYIPTILCRAFQVEQISFFGVQAIGGNANNVTVNYYTNAGAFSTSQVIGTIADGGKVSVNPCNVIADGFWGSATVTSTRAGIVAVVKVLSSVDAISDLNTAYVAPASGATKLALPFVRWTNNLATGFRSFIAIMNVGGSNATNVQAMYYDSAGNLATTVNVADGGNPLGQFIKRNTDACAAGLVGNPCNGNWNGSVIITSDQPVVVNSRHHHQTATEFGEDYLGIFIP